MTSQTLADSGDDPFTTRVGNVTGFSLHAGIAAKALLDGGIISKQRTNLVTLPIF